MWELVSAAKLAPSGNNAQPWRYRFLTGHPEHRILKQRLEEEGVFKQDFVTKAPLLIMCCGDPNAYPQGEFDPDFDSPSEARAERDVAIASQNLVLSATGLGLGTCYVGWLHRERAKQILKIPTDYVLPFAITVGYAAETPGSRRLVSNADTFL